MFTRGAACPGRMGPHETPLSFANGPPAPGRLHFQAPAQRRAAALVR
jgi:hypothetical protein